MKPASGFVFVAVVLSLVQIGNAQLFWRGAEKASSEFVPATAFTAVAMFPKKITKGPHFKLFPYEVVTAWGKKEFGFDPMLIKQVTWILQKPNEFPPEQDLGWAAVLHFEKMQGLAGSLIDQLEEKQFAGKTVFSGVKSGMPSVLVFDESTMIVGEEGFFDELLTANGKGKLVDLFNHSTVKGQILAYADVKTVRPMVGEMLKELDKFELPTPVEKLRLIPEMLDSVEVGLDTSGTLEMTILLHASSDKSAERISEIIVEGMQFGKTALMTQMAAEMDLNDPVHVATLQYTKRIAEKYATKLTPDVKGSKLTIRANEEILLAPLFASVIGWTGVPLQIDQKMTPENQLRQTALAFHNYASAYNKFPKRVITDEQGRALFSGRVALLPFVEQNALYENLHLDEPWDSPHNSQFTSMLVPSFALIDAEGATSVIRFPVYPNSLWDGEDADRGFSDVTDGTSNTIFAIYAPASSAIEWANPAPWNLSAINPIDDVFGDREEVTVAMLDGSTRVLKKSETSNEKLKAMLTISGGEVIRE